MTMRSKVSAMGLPVCVCRKLGFLLLVPGVQHLPRLVHEALRIVLRIGAIEFSGVRILQIVRDRKSTRLNSSHLVISYAVFCLKKKKKSDCADIDAIL